MSRAGRQIDSIIAYMPMTVDQRAFLIEVKDQLRSLNRWDRENAVANTAKKRARRRGNRRKMGAQLRELTEGLHDELYQLQWGCYPEDEPDFAYDDSYTFLDEDPYEDGMPYQDCNCTYCRAFYNDHSDWSPFGQDAWESWEGDSD